MNLKFHFHSKLQELIDAKYAGVNDSLTIQDIILFLCTLETS